MNHQYVCLTCRLRESLRQTSQAGLRRRQWFSHALNKAQNQRGPASVLSFDEKTSRKQAPSDRPKGRYSRQPLAPRQVLDSLQINGKDTVTRNSALTRPRLGPDSTVAEPEAANSPKQRQQHIPVRLWKSQQSFTYAARPSDNADSHDREALRHLLYIVNEYHE